MRVRTLNRIAGATLLLACVTGCTNPYDPGQRAVGGGLLGAGTALPSAPWPAADAVPRSAHWRAARWGLPAAPRRLRRRPPAATTPLPRQSHIAPPPVYYAPPPRYYAAPVYGY